MSLRGSTRDFSLPDIFQLLGFQEKSGILELEHEHHGKMKILFSMGAIVGIEYNEAKLEDYVKNYLVNSGKLTDDKNKKLNELITRSIQNFSNIIIELDIVDIEGLKQISRRELTNMILSVFKWSELEFRFIAMESVAYDQLLLYPIKSEEILLTTAEQMDEWPEIEKKLPPLNSILKKAVPGVVQKKTEDPILSLNEPESIIFKLIDDKKTIKKLEEIVPFNQFIIYKSICNLIDKGVCESIDISFSRINVKKRSSFKIKSVTVKIIPYILILILITCFWYSIRMYGGDIAQLTDKQKIRLNSLRRIFCIMKLDQVRKAVEAYNLLNNNYPENLQKVVDQNYIDKDDIIDPWDQKIVFYNTQKGVVIKSCGEDMKIDSDDDIVVGPPDYK